MELENSEFENSEFENSEFEMSESGLSKINVSIKDFLWFPISDLLSFRIKGGLSNNSFWICGSGLGSYELQYLFLIPTDIDKQLLLSDLPST